MLTGWRNHLWHLTLEYSHHSQKQPRAQEMSLRAPHTPQLPVRSPGLLNVVFCSPRLAYSGHLHTWRHSM